MKVHKNLEELLVDFLNTLDKDCVLIERIDIAKTVKHYTSTNSLALGKPEPLAKNKQTESFNKEDMLGFADYCRNGLLNTEYSIDKIDKHLSDWQERRDASSR